MNMRRLSYLVALMLAMGPQASHALLDPNHDSIGVYFDAEANTTWRAADMFEFFDAYLIVANPTVSINGFECTVSYAGVPASLVHVQAPDLGAGAVDSDPSRDGYAVMMPEPYPVSGNRIVLCRWRMFVGAMGEFQIFVGPGTTPTLPYDHPVLFVEGVPRTARTYTCESQMPVAWVNGSCPTIQSYPCYSPPFDLLALGVSVYGPGRTDVAIVATDYEATDGFDEGLDVPRPAPIGPGYLAVSIEHPEWPGGPRFSTDDRARFDYEDEFRAWTLLVETDLDGPIRIARGFSFHVDDFRLRDLQTGQVVAFQAYGEGLLFWNDGTPIVRRYQLISGPWDPASPVASDLPPVVLPRLTVSPNPFNPCTILSFELPMPARAEIRVLSLRGEEVAVLGGEALAAGRHQQEWRGLDRAGRSVPSGAYLAQLVVDGVPAGAAARLSLLR
ncbi:MAG: hypothetical protein IPI48_16930 [bacterium]|nr:hypothetical protein [bacterium]